MINYKHNQFFKNEVAKLRIASAEDSIWAFARRYLPDDFNLPPSTMHKEMAELFKNASQSRCKRIAIAGPRLYKQSELACLVYVLWSICFGKEAFILLVGDTLQQACEQLTIIKDNLETNPYLLQDFPEATGKNTKSWQAKYFTSRNGVKVQATGLTQEPQVFIYKGKRPSLIIFDTMQEYLPHEENRFMSDMEYLENILKHSCSTETNVIVVGTIMHRLSILLKLFRLKPDWIGKRYQAIISEALNQPLWGQWQAIFNNEMDYEGNKGPQSAEVFFNNNKDAMLEGAKALWPEYENYHKLMEIKLSMMDNERFNCEKQNSPKDPFAAKRERMREALFALERQLAEEEKQAKSEIPQPSS